MCNITNENFYRLYSICSCYKILAVFPVCFEWLKWNYRREYRQNPWPNGICSLAGTCLPGADHTRASLHTSCAPPTPTCLVPSAPYSFLPQVSSRAFSTHNSLLSFLNHHLSPFAWLTSLDLSHLFELYFLWPPFLIFLTRSTLYERLFLQALPVTTCTFLHMVFLIYLPHQTVNTVNTVMVETCFL